MMMALRAGMLLMVAAAVVGSPLVMQADHGDRPPVVFDHEGHLDAMDATGDVDCEACHGRSGRGDMLPDLVALDRDAAHDLCAGCHTDQDAGPHPVLCGACHVARLPEAAPQASEAMLGFDHDVHTDALADDCDRCHHRFDPTKGGLVPAGGDEAACVDCHETPADLRRASHGSCVVCHEREGQGPLRCVACHVGGAPTG